jgi:hypothetical protein
MVLMSTLLSRLRRSVIATWRPSSVRPASVTGTTCIGFAAFVLFIKNLLFEVDWHAGWHTVVVVAQIAAAYAGGWFLLIFTYAFFRLGQDKSTQQIVSEGLSEPGRPAEPVTGFAGIEYFLGSFNRTYVVFVTHEGLYGWKAEGTVWDDNPAYLTRYEQVLKDIELVGNIGAVRKLSSLRGGFFMPRGEIVSVEFISKKKRFVGAIPHNGRIRIALASGKTREFILPANYYDGNSIRQEVLLGGRLEVQLPPATRQSP